jgi:hypothetical protein
MPGLKTFSIILAAELLMLVLGFVQLLANPEISSEADRTEFMMGFSLPCTVTAMFVYCAIAIVNRKPKKIYRKAASSDTARSHQIPAFGN